RLKQLEWMVGHWVDESPGAVISIDCQWSEDKNFLLRSYTLRVGGRTALSGTQRIGWGPVTGKIKSWVLDFPGGSKEGLWTGRGNGWSVRLSGPLRDGKIVSETNVITFMSQDRAVWKSVDRTEGGRPLPDIGEFVMIRRPPRPQQ